MSYEGSEVQGMVFADWQVVEWLELRVAVHRRVHFLSFSCLLTY